MLWHFSCPFWEKAHSNNDSQQRHFEEIATTLISQTFVELKPCVFCYHSHDAMCLGFNGCRRCRADSCLSLTEWEACESRAEFLQLLITNILDRTPVCKVRGAQDLFIPSTQTVVLDDPCATTYKQFGKICICHIGYVAICQTGKIYICRSSNVAICQSL